MTRGLIAGGTDYSHQNLDDMVRDLGDWISGLQTVQKVFSDNITRLHGTSYWDNNGGDLIALFAYSAKFFQTSEKEIAEIIEELQHKVKTNHVTRIERLAKTAHDLNNRYGELWHSRDVRHEIIEDPNRLTFIMLEQLYVEGRDMVADMLDLSSLADRLGDFVGKEAILPNTEISIRILFLAANPRNTGRLRLDEEVRTISERLRTAQFRDRFHFVTEWAVRDTDLSEYLLRHSPHIVHFSGHGSNLGELILEDKNGNAKPVMPDALSKLFHVLKDNVRCVVLNACFSSTQAEAIAKEIECVLGMSKAIGDAAAVQFASGFYQALGYGRSVQTAFDLGCNQIDIASLKEEDTPQILVKPGVDAKSIVFAN